MKKNTFLVTFIALFFSTIQINSQAVDVSANWPNDQWDVNIISSEGTVGFLKDPRVDANFSYDDNLVGVESLEDIAAAASTEVDLRPATLVSPLPELEVVVEVDYVFAVVGSEVLKLQYYDPGATNPWRDWDSLAGNSVNFDYTNCNGLVSYTSAALNIAAFSQNQLEHFRYRFLFDDDGNSLGFCMGSPRIYSRETPLCIQVDGIDADSTLIDFDEAVISWNDGNAVTPQNGWDIEYGPTGFAQGSGTNVNTALNPYTVTGLTPETCYDVYVRAVCDNTISSDWAGPYNFCTTFMGPQCGGQFVDTGGTTGSYSNAEDITTVVNPDNTGDVVTAVFLSFNTESGYDNLKIYDGDSAASPLVGQYEGTTIPPTVEATLANGGSLTFVFHSDTSATRDGWVANLFCGPPTTCFMTENLAVDPASITITDATISWGDTNATPYTGTWQVQYGPIGFDPDTEGDFVAAPTNPFTLTGLNASTEYDFYVRAVCGATIGDDDSFWTGPSSFITKCDIIPAPYSQTFENGGIIPICWDQGAANNEDWLFGDDVTAPGHIGNAGNVNNTQTLSGGYFAWVEDSTPNNMNTMLLSPFIDLAGITNPTLGFYYISNDEFFFKHVRFSVDIWNNATSTWTDDVFVSNSNTNGWEQEFLDLSAYAGQVIQARFIVDENTTSTRDDFAIDDVYFGEMPSCINVNAIAINNIGSTDVVLTWGDAGNIPIATNWQIEYGPAGFAQGSAGGTVVDVDGAVTPLPYTLAGLNSQTDYDIYVRTDCGASDYSLWAGPISFTTLCPVFDAPYIEDFNDGGMIDACWDQNQNFDPWEFSNDTFSPGHVGNGGDTNGTSTASGGYFAFVDDSAAHTTNNAITTPLVNLTTLGGSAALSFYYLSDNEGSTNVDFSVDVWDGATWNTDVFTSSENTGGWIQGFINLELLTITGPVQARFIVSENNGNDINDDFAIDDVTFDLAPACYPISGTVVSNETENSVDLAWIDGLNAPGIDYIIEYGETGFALGSGTQETASTNPFTLTGLVPDTDYDFYVRAACTAADLSGWTNVASGTTLPTCLVVSNIFTSNITTTSFDVTWTDNNTDVPLGGWDVEYVYATFPQGSGTTTTVNATAATITGSDIIPSSFYDIYVRANCAADDSDPSRWVGPITVQTTIADPVNDLCVNAIDLTPYIDASCQPILGNNIQATQTTPALETDCADPAVDGVEPGFVLDDVWYKFTMPASGTAFVQTAFAGGMEDGAVSVYTGACGSLVKAVNSNGRDVCNDDADPDPTLSSDNNRFSRVLLLNQTPGEVFYVRVWSVDRTNVNNGNIHGQFLICVTANPLSNRSSLDVNEDIANDLVLSYYPNPVTNTLKLTTNEAITAVNVYSILGQEVVNKVYETVNTEINLDLQHLNVGTYFVKVQVGDKTKTVKIIKR